MPKTYSELHFFSKGFRILYWSGQLFLREKICLQARALTYYTMFCVVPFAALCFGIAKGFALDKVLKHTLNVHYAQHQQLLNWIYKLAENTLEQAQGGLIAGVGVVLLLITVVQLASHVEDSFNALWSLPSRRNIFGKFSSYVTLLVVTPFLLIVISSGLVVAESLLTKLVMRWSASAGECLTPLLALTQTVPYIIAWFVFSGIYYGVPNTRVRFHSAFVGGFVAGTLFQLLQSGLIVIQTALAQYNAIYGSFAILPLFLLWMQWSWQITLYGAVLAYVHQNAPTGRFDLLYQHHSRRERELYLLAVTRLAGIHFDSGRGAIQSKEIGNALHLQPSRVADLTEELCRAEVLLQSAENCFVPALPGTELTIQRVRERLANAGAAGIQFSEPELVQLQQQCNALQEAEARCSANLPLGEIK